VTANVAAEWQFDERWLISARLENLLDKHYRSHGSGIDAAGRNIFVSLQAAWQ
jgi:outer membrane receptor protein involved in Fe transport